MPLPIYSNVLDEIFAAAVEHGSSECMGLLVSRPGETAISSAYLLEAEASAAHAEASPLALKQAATQIRAAGCLPRGMFHSHGRHAVFHSGVDHETAHRLLPAMAEANFEPAGTPATPWVVSPTRAALPVRGGSVQFFDLAAPTPGHAAFDAQPVWQSVRYQTRETAEPAATLSAGLLELAAGGVAVTVGLPEGLAVSAIVADPAPARLARIYSLVVNCRGDADAKCLVVAEVGTEWFQRLDPCEVMTISREAAPSAAGHFLSAGPRLLVA